MTDLQRWVEPTCTGLAELLSAEPAATWGVPSLCEQWSVRHVIAHVTMPARLTPEQFGTELAAAGGDFTVLVRHRRRPGRLAAGRHAPRAAPVADPARVAASGQRCSRRAEPRRHPRTGRDDPSCADGGRPR